MIEGKRNRARTRRAVEIKSLAGTRFVRGTKQRNLLACPVSLTTNPDHRTGLMHGKVETIIYVPGRP